jgi:hypothetical protein
LASVVIVVEGGGEIGCVFDGVVVGDGRFGAAAGGEPVVGEGVEGAIGSGKPQRSL